MNTNGGSVFLGSREERLYRRTSKEFYNDTKTIISKMSAIIKDGTSTLGYVKGIFSNEPINRDLFKNRGTKEFIEEFSEKSVNMIFYLHKILLNICSSKTIEIFDKNKINTLEKLKESIDKLKTLNDDLNNIEKYQNTMSIGYNFFSQSPVTNTTTPTSTETSTTNPISTGTSTTNINEDPTTGGKRHRKNQTRRHTNRRKRSQRHH
jgi:hypothetical protein